MQEAIDLVNSWLCALNPNLSDGLDEQGTITLALDPERSLSMRLGDEPANLHWALPILVPGAEDGLSAEQMTRAAALNYAQEATRGARLALIEKPDRLHLLYRCSLDTLDQNRFTTITGELSATAQQLAVQLADRPAANDDHRFHASV